jgi:hypothetical protein
VKLAVPRLLFTSAREPQTFFSIHNANAKFNLGLVTTRPKSVRLAGPRDCSFEGACEDVDNVFHHRGVIVVLS